MSVIMQALSKLSSAEEFLEFFGLPYDQRVVNVNRLHILKRFNQYLARHSCEGRSEAEVAADYRALLERAYHDFVKSDAVTERVFKVFHEAQGTKTFSVQSLRESLPARRALEQRSQRR